jgi:hypothetical protein
MFLFTEEREKHRLIRRYNRPAVINDNGMSQVGVRFARNKGFIIIIHLGSSVRGRAHQISTLQPCPCAA